MRLHHLLQPLHAELFSVDVQRFGHAIGIQRQHIAWFEREWYTRSAANPE